MSPSNAYFSLLKGTLDGVVTNLRSKGIHERHLSFGDEGVVPKRKPYVPTDARSEFLANRAMGDWAEQMLAKAFSTRFLNGGWCNMVTQIALPPVILGSGLPTWRGWKKRASSGSARICCCFQRRLWLQLTCPRKVTLRPNRSLNKLLPP